MPPLCWNLSKATRTRFMKEVKRDTTQDKLSGLMSITPILVDEMAHNTSLLSSFFGIFKSSWYMHIRTTASLLAIIINVLVLMKIERVRDDR